MTDEEWEPRTLNEEHLRSLSGTMGSLTVVAGTSLFPRGKPTSLVVELRDDHFPPDVDDVTLELRVFTNDDFHITYAETYLGERRQCRWDRHDQPHSTRDHFHSLPDASTDDAEDRSYPSSVADVLRDRILPWVDNRIGMLWDEP